MPHAHLLSAEAYIADLTRSISHANSSIYCTALVIIADTSTEPLIEALCQAARRGVTVAVAADLFFSYTETPRPHRGQQLQALRTRLLEAGVAFRWLGSRNGITMFAHRNHSKFCVIDSTVYSFGGVNLCRKGIESVDYMLKVTDATLARELTDEYQRIIAADSRGGSDAHRTIETKIGTILLDGGAIGTSLIYRRAVEHAKNARHITYVSQYCPTGELSVLLGSTPSHLFFNHWHNAESFHKWLIRWNMHRYRHATEYPHQRYLHAKCMIFERTDGSTVAITGSHNFVMGGSWLGTREIALETTNQSIIAQLQSFVDYSVTSPKLAHAQQDTRAS